MPRPARPDDDKHSCRIRKEALLYAAREQNIPDSAMHDPDQIPQLIKFLEERSQSEHAQLEHLQVEHAALVAEHKAQFAENSAQAELLHSLPDADAIAKITRYENMLDRQMHRALSEFRRRRAMQEEPDDSCHSEPGEESPPLGHADSAPGAEGSARGATGGSSASAAGGHSRRAGSGVTMMERPQCPEHRPLRSLDAVPSDAAVMEHDSRQEMTKPDAEPELKNAFAPNAKTRQPIAMFRGRGWHDW